MVRRALCRALVLAAVLSLCVPAAFAAGAQETTRQKAATSEPISLQVFWQMDPKATTVIKSYSEMGFFKEMEKRTGVKMQFIHPPADPTLADQQLNLMLASGDLPDMIYYTWSKVPGGIAKLIADGTILKLNDYMPKYSPNMLKALAQNPEWKKQITLDDGTFFKYPKIKADQSILVTSGLQVRTDWLKKVGLSTPKTIDEWYTVLKAFREKDPNGNGDPRDEIPYASFDKEKSLRVFGLAWKVTDDFYDDNGTVRFGPVEPGFKPMLTTLAKWYKEGLIDQDYLSIDRTNFESKIIANKVGAYYGMCSGFMGKFLDTWAKAHPDYQLEAVWPPIATDGKKYGLEYQPEVSDDGLSITKKNKYVVESVKWCDYIYGPEGTILSNYGIEGVSYTMVNGKPQFTDEILKNPQGLAVINALHKYTYSVSTGAMFQTYDVISKTLTYPSQMEAYKRWTDGATKVNLTSLSPTTDEGKRLSKLMGDIRTYVVEMLNKFIMGQEPVDNYDKFVRTIKGMGLDEALRIQQAVFDRYNAKK